MKTQFLCVSMFFLCSLVSALEPPQSHPVPVGIREADKLRNPADLPPQMSPQRKPTDPMQLKREANEMAKLAQSVPMEIDQVAGGRLPKDLDGQLKQIEKLAKHLLREVSH